MADMGITYGGQPLLDPARLQAECQRVGLETGWFNQANAFRSRLGCAPGSGRILMARRHWEKLDPNSEYDLVLKTPRGQIIAPGGLPPRWTETVTLKSLLPTGVVSLTPGLRGDLDEALLIELVDQKYLHQFVPIDAAYNVLSTPDADYYTATISGGATPYTWAQIGQSLWETVGTSRLGSWPGLPFTPDGTPANLRYFGMYALAALGDFLARLGCALKLNPFTDEFSIVQVGIADTDFTTWLSEWDAFRVHDSYPASCERARVPEKVRVLFRKLPPVPGQTPFYAVEVATPTTYLDTTDVEAGTVHIVHDDLPAIYTSGGSLSNSSDLNSRAAERAADYARVLAAGLDPVARVYALASTDSRGLPGKKCWWVEWQDLGRGMRTVVGRYPDVPMQRLCFSSLRNEDADTYTATFTTATFSGGVHYPPDGSPTTISANTNNLALTTASTYFLDVTADVNLTGIVAGANGRRLILVNYGTATLKILHEDSGSTAANRIHCPYAQNVVFPTRFAAELQYDTAISRWRLLWVSDILNPGATQTASIGTDQDDYAFNLGLPSLAFDLSASIELTGFAGGVKGYVLRLAVVYTSPGLYTLTLKHLAGTSAAANRIVCPYGQDFNIISGGGATLYYDGSLWRVLATRETYTTATALLVVGPNAVAVDKSGLLFNDQQLKVIVADGANYPEMALTRRGVANANLAGGEYVSRHSGYGRVSGSDVVIGGVDVKYDGTGTQQTGSLELFGYDAGSKKIGVTVVKDGDVKIENITGDTLAYYNSSKELKSVTLDSSLSLSSGTLSAVTSSATCTWVKVTKTYANLSAAAMTNDIEVYSLPTRGAILGAYLNHTASFTGGAITTYSLDLGITGNPTKYVGAYGVTGTPPSSGPFYQSVFSTPVMEDGFAATSIRLKASADANLDTATSGSVDIYLLVSVLP